MEAPYGKKKSQRPRKNYNESEEEVVLEIEEYIREAAVERKQYSHVIALVESRRGRQTEIPRYGVTGIVKNVQAIRLGETPPDPARESNR